MDGNTELIGNYRIIAPIATGSYARVCQAHHIILTNRTVALKILHAHLSSAQHERFTQEARLLKNLQHRYILPVLDVGIDNGTPYLVTAYASGSSLRRLLNHTTPTLLNRERVLTILTQVGEALHHAHQNNIVHGNLKPENILFSFHGEALLTDFGITTVLSITNENALANADEIFPYMAPEQFHGAISKEGDQYALACIAYELLTGRQPFSTTDSASLSVKHATEQPIPLRALVADIPEHVEQAVLRALAKEGQERHANIIAFLNALNGLPQRTKEEWLEQGIALHQSGKYQDALEAFEQALRFDLAYAPAYHGKGNTLYKLKRYPEALEAYKQALRFDPHDAFAYHGKGHALSKLKRYSEALEAYKQALRLDPYDTSGYHGQGSVLCRMKRYSEALAAYEQALRLDAHDAYTYSNIGNALYGLQRYQEALEAYQQALQLDPNDSYACNGTGNALYRLERYEEALAAYDQSLRLNPQGAYAYYGKGLVFNKLQRMEEAQTAYEQAKALDHSQ